MSVDICQQGREGGDHARRCAASASTRPYGKEFQRFLRHGIGLHHAGLLPKYRLLVRAAGAEGPAQGGQRHRHAGRRRQHPHPHRAVHAAVQVRRREGRHPVACASSSRSPGAPGARASTTAAAWWRRRPSTSSRTGAWRPRPPPARRCTMQQAARQGLRPLGQGHLRAPGRRHARAAGVALRRHATACCCRCLQGEQRASRAAAAATGGCCRADRALATRAPAASGASSARRAAACFRTLRQRRHRRARAATSARAAACAVAVSAVAAARLLAAPHAVAVPASTRWRCWTPQLETYALDVLTLVESILENPRRGAAARSSTGSRTEKMAEMKAAGRGIRAAHGASWTKLEWPKPNRDFIYDTFNAFADSHPWVGQREHRAPSRWRARCSSASASFDDYVREYGLQRSEGVLLRYLSRGLQDAGPDACPPRFRTPGGGGAALHLAQRCVRGVDASLLEEWESHARPRRPRRRRRARSRQRRRCRQPRAAPRRSAADPRALAARVRTDLHRLLGALARKDYEDAAAGAAPARTPTATPRLDRRPHLAAAMAPFYEDHSRIARRPPPATRRTPSCSPVASDSGGSSNAACDRRRPRRLGHPRHGRPVRRRAPGRPADPLDPPGGLRGRRLGDSSS